MDQTDQKWETIGGVFMDDFNFNILAVGNMESLIDLISSDTMDKETYIKIKDLVEQIENIIKDAYRFV
jgi:hypothetical protein